MKKIALLSLVLAAGTAMAAEPFSYEAPYTASTVTRSQVQAEFAAAAKNDTLPQTGEVGEFAVETKSNGASRERAAVQAEGRQAASSYLIRGEV